MFTHQAQPGATDYQALSESMQGKLFDSLIENIDIKKGFKIIDIGCGTGNNSSKLSNLVGDEGIIVAIDPIKERIDKGKEVYGSSLNLQFAEAGAKDCWKYGNDFDLAVSSNVLHFIPVCERKKAFEGVLKCLKPGALFVFCTAASDNHSMSILLEKISYNEEFLRNYNPTTKNKLEQLLNGYGFKDVVLKKKEISLSMPNLDKYLCWVASSLHIHNYTKILTKLREFCNNSTTEDTAFLYNNKGQVVYNHYDYLYGSCRK